jgi:prepilin-type N-terminal cleavage/methylation domain-containing protein/prepilin-type processing-associated H-X9-DG protein
MSKLEKHVFTLIEMLVVIAIIALLSSILIPVVKSALARAELTKCQSNLHQLSLGFLQYANENEGKLPYQQKDSSTTWHVDIAPYLDGFTNADFFDLAQDGDRPAEIYACPSSEHTVRSGNYSDFGMNFMVNDHGGSQPFQRRLFNIPEPGKVLLLADAQNCARRLSPYSTDGNMEDRHQTDQVNVLYVDGRVDKDTLDNLVRNLSGDPRTTLPWGWDSRQY